MNNPTKSYELARAFGYLFIPEVEELFRLAKSTEGSPDSPIFVNIGAGSGTSGLALAEGNEDAIIFTVDISPSGPLGGLENERNAFAGTNLTLPHQILGDSKEVGKNFRSEYCDDEIDILFIDGGHLEEEARGDIVLWTPYLKVGGYVSVHDYDSVHWPAVKKVVDEFFTADTWELVSIKKTLITFRKIK